MGKVILSGVSKGMTVPVNYKANFADNTWEQIIDACQKNKVPDTWLVADQKTMTINGTDYLIDIIGKNHDTYADGSGTAPLTFQLHDYYSTKYAMNSSATNSGGWTSCKMRSTHLPSILSLMPSSVQAGIKEVKKLTTAGSKSTTIKTTADKLFLLSAIELLGSDYVGSTGEGNQYSYYVAGNSTDKYLNGSKTEGWLRSPNTSSSEQFCVAWGTFSNANANGERAIAPAFCF